MDGLNRKEVSYPTIRVRRTEEQARRDDYLSQDITTSSTPTSSTLTISTNTNNQYKYNNHAYIVSGKDVLRNWARTGAAIILLPDKLVSWRDKSIRILADEIAFATQAVVIIPDIYRSSVEDNSESGMDISSHCTDEHADTATTTATNSTTATTMFDDIVATIQFVRSEYSAGTVSFAGIGSGAGVALEASCILHDIGRMAQYIDIQTQLRDTGNTSQGTENVTRDPGNASIEAVAIENALSDPNSTEYKVLYRVFNTDRSIFPRVDITNSIQSLQSTAVAVDSTTIPMQSAVPSRSGSTGSDSSTITSSSSGGNSCSSSDGSIVQEEDLDTILYEDFNTIVDISNRHGSERASSNAERVSSSAERAKKEDSTASSGSQDSNRSVSSVSNSMNIYTCNL